MARSRTGLRWNIPRNLGYHLALRNFGAVGFNPEGQAVSVGREADELRIPSIERITLLPPRSEF